MNDLSPTTRRSRWIGLALAFGILAPAMAQDPAAPAGTAAKSQKVDPILEQLLEAHNQVRAKEGHGPLKLEPKLTDAALVQAKDMADRERMGHDGSDGSTPEQRIVKAGYHYLRAGENVAMGFRDVEEVMVGWMESPGHRKNIMADFTEVGLALVVGKDNKPYWAADFGAPMPKFDPAVASKELVRLINAERTRAKVAEINVDEKLAKAAQEQAALMAKNRGGAASFDGIDQKPYADLALSVASGHPDPSTMLKVIVDSPDMKAQILGKYSKVGVGYANAEDGVPFWCLILGNPARR